MDGKTEVTKLISKVLRARAQASAFFVWSIFFSPQTNKIMSERSMWWFPLSVDKAFLYRARRYLRLHGPAVSLLPLSSHSCHGGKEQHVCAGANFYLCT